MGTAISKLLKKMNTSSQGFDSAQAMIERTNLSLRDLELMASNDSTSFKKLTDSLGLTQKELKGSMNIVKSFGQYANTAGYDVKEFAKIYEKDAVEAMTLFVDGLNNVERNGKNAVEILNEMGLTEVRLSNTILALAGSDIKLTDAIGMANNAWDENIALQTEVDKRYATTESKINMLKNSFTALGITLFGTVKDNFIDAIKSMADETNTFIDDLEGDAGLKGKLAEMGRVLGSAVKAIFKSLKEIMPVLLDFLVSFGKLVGKLIPAALKVLTPLLKTATKVAKALVDMSDALAPLIAGFIGYKIGIAAVTKVIKAYNIVTGLFQIATKKATVAQLGLNAAQLATPWGIAAAGIAALVAGYLVFSSKAKKASQVSQELTDSVRNRKAAVDEEIESLEELEKSRNETINNTLIEEERLQELSRELKLITDENGKIKKGYEERAKVITNELSTALGIEIEATDGVIKNYQEIQKEIDNLIEKKKTLAIVEAQEEEYNEAQKYFNDDEQKQNFADSENRYKEAVKAYETEKENKKRLQEIQEYYRINRGITKSQREELENMGYFSGTRRSVTALGLETFETTINNRLKEDKDGDTNTVYEQYLEEKEVYEKLNEVRNKHLYNSALYKENLKAIQEERWGDVTWDSLSLMLDQSEGTQQKIEIVNKKLKTNIDDIDDYVKKYRKSQGKVKEETADVILKQIDEMNKARDVLKKQYDSATTEADRTALKKALETVDEQIKVYTNGSKEIKEIIAKQVKDMIGEYTIGRELTGSQYALLWEKISTETGKGTKLTQELINQWVNLIGNTINTGEIQWVKDANGMWTAMYGEFQIGSNLTKEQMDTLMGKINEAVLNGTPITITSIQNMLTEMGITLTNDTQVKTGAEEVSDEIVDSMPKASDGITAMGFFLNGLASVLKPKNPIVKGLLAGAKWLATQVVEAYNNGQEAQSPSKKAKEAMHYFMSGLMLQMNSEEGELLNQAESLGEKLTTSLQDSLGQVKANVAGSVNLDGKVNSGFASNGLSTSNDNSKTINWTQNYNSPKPLSRYEMYTENKRIKNQIQQELNATT